MLAPALIGLVGVIVGATASVGAQAWLDDTNREKTQRAELRQARRLVTHEVMEIERQFHGIASAKKWDVCVARRAAGPRFFQTSAWDKHGPVLARDLSDQPWYLASTFYGFLTDLRAFAARTRCPATIARRSRGTFRRIQRQGGDLIQLLRE